MPRKRTIVAIVLTELERKTFPSRRINNFEAILCLSYRRTSKRKVRCISFVTVRAIRSLALKVYKIANLGIFRILV
jgi:hypothetical protein